MREPGLADLDLTPAPDIRHQWKPPGKEARPVTANEAPLTTALPLAARGDAVARWVFQVKRRHGRGYAAQVADMVRYNRGAQRLQPVEYYLYRLYERDRFTEEQRRAFIGHTGRRRIVRALNDVHAVILANDKLVTYGYLKGMGFPIAELRVLFHPTRGHGDLTVLRDAEAVAAYLRNGLAYPSFGKPLGRSNAIGAASLCGYRAADDSIVMAGDKAASVTGLAKATTGFLPHGYLFVEHLWPHPDVRAMVGERLCTARVYVVLEPEGPRIIAAVWKIVTGANMADNFVLPGNLLGAIDLETGALTRIVGGSGPDETEHETHPDTGGRLLGFRLPDWALLKDTVRAAAAAFPRLGYQGWDVAVTPRGPVLVELNSAGDMSLWQRAAAKGMMNDRFHAILSGRGR